ncbi:MAG: SpaA isopeptide-forming pilin-related protein [Erysipelotrichaceae bacterium]|nr:SpaA isopeptide-forming pilin-related protein [Erysipelotrichaceae bacterium]
MKKIYAFILSLLCMIGMSLPVYAEGTPVQDLNNQKVELTINNVSENEEFRVWKVVDIEYETNTHKVTYAWNTDFKDYFKDKTIKTPQEFAAITNSELNGLLSGLPSYIRSELASNKIKQNGSVINSGENTQIVMSGDKALNMGGYFIEPIVTTKVYQPMFVSIVPTVSGGSYQLNDRGFTAKHTDCTISKLVSNDGNNYDSYTCASFSKTDKYNRLYYKVTLNVPKYVSPVPEDIDIKFEDTLPNGIDLDSQSIKIYGVNGIKNSPINEIPKTIDGKKITIDFKNYYTTISSNYDDILITYEANLNENAVKNFVDNANVNSAKYTYTKYPYSGSVSDKNVVKTSSAKVYTYDVKIQKLDNDDNLKSLGGAQFDLYRLANQDELNDSSVVKETIDSKDFVKIANGLTIETSSEGTDNKGTYLISGLVPGEYRLIETRAPSGYNLDNTPIKIEINQSQESTLNVKIYNKKGSFTLPETGSTGKLLYSLAGLALASIATICLIVVYKKGKKG